MKDTYNDWIERVVAGRKGKPLSSGELVSTSAEAPTPFSTIEFVKLKRPGYVVEVGKRGSDYIYHFYPSANSPEFEDKMAEAFLQVFKTKERIEAVYTEELSSWAIKALGFGNSIMGDELAIKVLDTLDSLLT